MNGDIGIGDLQYGVSADGVEQFLQDIKQVALTDASEALDDTDAIETVLDTKWAGQSKEYFKMNLRKDAEHVADQFENLYHVLENEIRAAAAAMIEKDQSLVEWDDR